MLAKYPGENYQEIISRVLNATDPVPALAGKCVTGGRLNLRNALSPPIKLAVLTNTNSAPFTLQVSAGPSRVCVIEVTTNFQTWTPVNINITGSNGTFNFTDTSSTNSAQRYYRAYSTL